MANQLIQTITIMARKLQAIMCINHIAEDGVILLEAKKTKFFATEPRLM